MLSVPPASSEPKKICLCITYMLSWQMFSLLRSTAYSTKGRAAHSLAEKM